MVASRLVGGADSPLLDDLVQEANLMMLAARIGPRSAASSDGWITSLAWRTVSAHFRRGNSDRKWIAPDEVDFEQMPAKDEAPNDEVLLSDWLASAVAGDARDSETLEMLLYKARLDATYDQVAADHGLTSVALRSRITAFKEKYEAKWRKHRAMLVLLLVFAAVAVAVAGWLWLRSMQRAEQTVPAPTAPLAPTAHPSATASAEDTPFEPAAPPTQTARTAPSPRAPAPRAPAPTPPDTTQRTNQWGKPIR
ncbi:MAG: hypothetical protein ACRENE_35230 [Polyangiaceae bacterium]